MVIPSIAADPLIERLRACVAHQKGAIHVSGVWGSSAPMLSAECARNSQRLHLYLVAHSEQADNVREDVELFLSHACELLPAFETLPGEGAASGEIEAERLRMCGLLLAQGQNPRVIGVRNSKASTTKSGNSSLNSQIPKPPVNPKSQISNLKSEISNFKPQIPNPPVNSKSQISNSASPLKSQISNPQSQAPFSPFIVAPIQALMQPVPSPATLRRNTLRIRVGEVIVDPDPARHGGLCDAASIMAWLVQRGFQRLDLVESPGDVAWRGDILDIFARGETAPYRVQFDGNVVESLRRFDVSTQRSIESLNELSLTAIAPDANRATREASFFDYLPADTLLFLDDPAEIQRLGETLDARLGAPDRIFRPTQVLARCEEFTHVQFTPFGGSAFGGEAQFDFGVTSVARFDAAADPIEELAGLAASHNVYVLCDNVGEQSRLEEMLRERAVPVINNITLALGVLQRGFLWTRTSTAVVPHHEIFLRRRQTRRLRKVEPSRAIQAWTDLAPGDFVVHVIHGIAAYRGLREMRKSADGQKEEFLTLEFAEGATVHVPCSQIDLVQKYIGSGARKPTLSTLGGKRWSKTKERVIESVTELAESLLRTQAMRAHAEGTAYPPDTEWQREFEAAFLYEETEDQIRVAAEIRDDLTRPRPMDRLICGDVGYGKTELAMRAAFKVVEFGRQVAVLVPTTVLAEQHYESFKERMADYPFTITSLSRFRGQSEQKAIVQQIRTGQVDIVVGTHRLLSRDVAFADLGLVVIDEEQRFGVEHKERLRGMRATVDVLTLTATPIPRTLHMSLLGIRDISSLQTPPVDRRAIATQVRPFDRQLIRDAILREMNRDGQVYFVHNFVQSIAAMADQIRRIVPEARIIYGHGQMHGDELEAVMHKFTRREADVLVSTTIIESGIDIPNANTIFINRADRFGLADLHQLRGRVGRAAHRAYCYLLLSPDRPVTSKAAKRLKTIEEFSELGAGFRIAMRDLEIRGAGNLLGAEQSGHIAAVGYELYCQLVEQSVRRLKNEPDPSPPPVHVDLDVTAHVPRHYAGSDRSRIEIYRRIVACRTIPDLRQLEKDLVDAFGPVPPEVTRILELAEIRVLARRFGIRSISLQKPDVIFSVEQLTTAEPLFVDAPGSVRMPDAKTIHLRLPASYLETNTLVAVLRRMMNRAIERSETAPART